MSAEVSTLDSRSCRTYNETTMTLLKHIWRYKTMIDYPKNYAPLAEEEMEYTSGGLSINWMALGSTVLGVATKGLDAAGFTGVSEGAGGAGGGGAASEDAGSMVEVGTTIVLYIAGDVPADAPAEPEAPSDTGTPAGGDAAQGGVEYDTD